MTFTPRSRMNASLSVTDIWRHSAGSEDTPTIGSYKILIYPCCGLSLANDVMIPYRKHFCYSADPFQSSTYYLLCTHCFLLGVASNKIMSNVSCSLSPLYRPEVPPSVASQRFDGIHRKRCTRRVARFWSRHQNLL
jgi:hypothetical protein